MKFVVSFLAIALAMVSSGWACKSIEELDQCAYEISFLNNHDIKVPENDADVVAGCEKAKAGLKCLKDEAESCMKSTLKPMVLKVLGDAEKHLNTHCDNPGHRAEFLKHVQCFKDPAKADAVRKCGQKHVAMLEKVATLPMNLRIGGGCCTAHSFKDCALEQITKLCSGETGEYFNDLVAEAAEESVSMVCGDMNSVDRCNAKFDPAAWGELKAIASSDAVPKHTFKTALPIIIKMLKEAGLKK